MYVCMYVSLYRCMSVRVMIAFAFGNDVRQRFRHRIVDLVTCACVRECQSLFVAVSLSVCVCVCEPFSLCLSLFLSLSLSLSLWLSLSLSLPLCVCVCVCVCVRARVNCKFGQWRWKSKRTLIHRFSWMYTLPSHRAAMLVWPSNAGLGLGLGLRSGLRLRLGYLGYHFRPEKCWPGLELNLTLA